MTWSPRNRCGEKKDDGDEDEDGVSDSDFEEQSCEDEKLGVRKGTNYFSHASSMIFLATNFPITKSTLREVFYS